MKMTITSTGMIAIFDGRPVRVWRGVTEEGVTCCVFVQRIKIDAGQDQEAFQRELIADFPPGESMFIHMF